jgi:hypothetical protein
LQLDAEQVLNQDWESLLDDDDEEEEPIKKPVTKPVTKPVVQVDGKKSDDYIHCKLTPSHRKGTRGTINRIGLLRFPKHIQITSFTRCVS